MRHTFPDDVKNSDIEKTIDEYVRLERNREILRQHWFGGMTFEQLATHHKISVNAVKDIIYGIGDKILIRLNK